MVPMPYGPSRAKGPRKRKHWSRSRAASTGRASRLRVLHLTRYTDSIFHAKFPKVFSVRRVLQRRDTFVRVRWNKRRDRFHRSRCWGRLYLAAPRALSRAALRRRRRGARPGRRGGPRGCLAARAFGLRVRYGSGGRDEDNRRTKLRPVARRLSLPLKPPCATRRFWFVAMPGRQAVLGLRKPGL